MLSDELRAARERLERGVAMMDGLAGQTCADIRTILAALDAPRPVLGDGSSRDHAQATSVALEVLANAVLSLTAIEVAIRRGGYHAHDMADAVAMVLAPIRGAHAALSSAELVERESSRDENNTDHPEAARRASEGV